MVTFDPAGRGPGSETVRYVIGRFGEDFARRLYLDQQVAVSTDTRQIADWIARGTYDVAINASREAMERLIAEGLPVANVELEDGRGYLSAGWIGAIAKMDRAPHPKAAAVMINWLVSKEGAEMLGRATTFAVARNDVTNDWVPRYTVPDPRLQYPDHHSWEFLTHDRDVLDDVRERMFQR
jgi:ABC-type Fe3+ transport system substrate-binding protein